MNDLQESILSGHNIGPFRDFIITMPAITLIAGENGTGKSTISKSLYMLLNAPLSIDKLILNEKRRIQTRLRILTRERSSSIREMLSDDDLLNDIVSKNPRIADDLIWYRALQGVSSLEDIHDQELLSTLIKRIVNAEFDGQLLTMGKSDGYVGYEGSGSDSSIRINGDKYDISAPMIGGSVLYLESISLLDYISSMRHSPSTLNHRNNAGNMLEDAVLRISRDDESLIDEIGRKRLKKDFSDSLHSMINGRFGYDRESRSYYFESASNKYSLENVASGVKSFAALDLFISYGVLKSDSVLILDEPETNLHPLLQVRYAELLCSLIKKTNIRLIINSHSPFFIEALALYASKELPEDSLRLYFTRMHDDYHAEISDVTKDPSVIYESLAAPYEIMDRIWSRI